MRSFLRNTVMGVLALLCGCTVPSFLRPPTIDELNELVARQEFGEALRELQDIPETHPERDNYRALEAEVQDLADEYARSMIARSEAIIEEEGDWTSAIAMLVEARRKYPTSEEIDTAEQNMRQRQTMLLNDVDDRLVLLRAERLLQELPLRQEIARVDPYHLAGRRQVAAIQTELAGIVERLSTAGEEALLNGDYFTAEGYIIVAARIERTPRVQAALDQIQREYERRAMAEQEEIRLLEEAEAQVVNIREDDRRREETARIRAERERRQREVDQHLNEARDALDQQQLLEARRLLDEAAILSPDSPEVAEIREELNQRIVRQVEIQLERGNDLYTNGHYEQAKQIWEVTLELDPDNSTVGSQLDTVRSNLERVDRVLASLRDLQTRRVRPPPPPPSLP
jgi:tetratricopeptide (TPR) repeat protein